MSDPGIPSAPREPPVTAADLELLSTSSEELGNRARVFCFDRERYRRRIASGEHWQQLLQSHLYFDHVITLILVEALVNPDAINASRMGFVQKLQFIQALGLLRRELIAPVEFLNNLRNKIAHILEFEITDKEIQDFSNCIPKEVREVMSKRDSREPGPLRFNELLEILLLQLEVIRQERVFERLQGRKSHIRLRTVLEKTPGAVYVR